MGNGRYKNGKFDFNIIANFSMTANDYTEWERTFKKVNELLYDASEGQMQLGQLFVCDDSIGIETAEMVLHPSGDPSYGYGGGFGVPGYAIHLMPYVKTRGPLTVIHEMGHQVWDLGDEYTMDIDTDTMDKSSPSPDQKTIPVYDSGRADNELRDLGARVFIMMDSDIERKNVDSDTATQVIADSNFSDLPTNSPANWVQYQADAECRENVTDDFCIMEKTRDAAGYFDAAGTWHTVTNPVTEFCSPSNHDPDHDTKQHSEKGESCWETIQGTDGFGNLTMPDPAAPGPTTGWSDPDWIVLDKQPRFALVLDRSGSMSAGNKMPDTQHGAVYWVEHCSEVDDLLTIVWYDHVINTMLALTQVSAINIANVVNDIQALTPRGSTNIRDGLYQALDEIESPSTRAAVQASLLLTDGKHNTPLGSSSTEVIPSYQEGGTRIYALGVGDTNNVNMDPLDQLASETGGRSYYVGDNQPGDIEAAMVEIRNELDGGIITTVPSTFPDSKPNVLDRYIGKYIKERPSLWELLKPLKIKDLEKNLVETITKHKELGGRVIVIPVNIEEKSLRATFTVVHPKDHDLWLYLLDPDGAIVDMNGPGIQHVVSSAPHEFAIVNNPKAGRWHMVVLRTEPGPSFSFKAVAGSRNPNLQAFGRATKDNCSEAPVKLTASARWRHELSNLLVFAEITGPDNKKTIVKFDDFTNNEPNSGSYHGFFVPKKDGAYTGIITIMNTGEAIRARPMYLATHTKEKVSLKVDAPKFERRIPVSFYSGKKPTPEDDEKKNNLTEKFGYVRKRRTELKSVKIK